MKRKVVKLNHLRSDIIRAVELKVGLKIRCRDYMLAKIKNETYIQENFKLNIKRLNRWWYSVYFAEKEIQDSRIF